MTNQRKRTDWDAVHRDFRTGQFTEHELADKYGVSRSAVNKQARTKGWTKDLQVEIKQATNAKLVADMVAAEVAEGGKKVADVVLAAAEVNKQVILGHRSDIAATREVAASLLQELSDARLLASEQELLAEILAGGEDADKDKVDRARQVVKKALDFGNRIQSVKSLAETFTKLQAMERTAFNLDEEGSGKGDELTIEDFIEAASARAKS
jgi:predicted transcriptional regulator